MSRPQQLDSGLDNIIVMLILICIVKAKWLNTVYDRINAIATINFSTQFGVATIREQRERRLVLVRAKKKFSENINNYRLIIQAQG